MKLSTVAAATALLAGTFGLVSCGADATAPAADHSTATTTSQADPGDSQGAAAVPTGQAGTPRGAPNNPRDIDSHDADQVATRVVRTTYTLDTRLDNSPQDGLRRATEWLTDKYAHTVEQPRPGRGGADWTQLAGHDGYTTVTVQRSGEPDQHKANSSANNKRALKIRIAKITYHARDGRTLRRDQIATFVRLVRIHGAGWRVTALTTG